VIIKDTIFNGDDQITLNLTSMADQQIKDDIKMGLFRFTNYYGKDKYVLISNVTF